MTKLYFVRHGKTEQNAMELVQGWSDSPLTVSGMKETKNTASGLADIPFNYAYSSDLSRAVQTAEIIVEENHCIDHPEIIQISELREINFGKYEKGPDAVMWREAFQSMGVTSKEELFALEHGTAMAFSAIAVSDETGQAEDYLHFAKRQSGAVSLIVRDVESKGGGNVLVVSHGAAIATLIGIYSGNKVAPITNASVSLVEYVDGDYSVRSVGDTSYMKRGEKLRRHQYTRHL